MLVNKNELASILSLSVSMVNKLIAKGMPNIKIGKAIRFEPEVVLKWIKDNYNK